MSPLTLAHSHRWDLSPQEASQLQEKLRTRVRLETLHVQTVETIAGVDVGFRNEQARAAVVVLAFPGLEILEHQVGEVPITFPYVPGLLSFRETPAILETLEKLPELPDVLMFDGQGIAHPRRFGIASHIGVLLDRPTLGCAKSLLVGRHSPLGEDAGSMELLKVGEEVVGAAVRTRTGVRPVYVSPGHRIDTVSAVALVLESSRGYRLPEPTRLADRLASRRGPFPSA